MSMARVTNRRATEWPWASAGGGPPNISRPTRRGRTSWLVVVIEESLERLVVNEAVCAVDFFRDAVSAFLDPPGGFGINWRAIDNPLHHGVQVCQDLPVNAGGFTFGGAHTRIVLGTGSLSRTLKHERTACAGGALFSPRVRPAQRRA